MAASIILPKGRKPDKLMRDALMVALNREAKGADGKPTRKLYIIADRLVEKAMRGEITAIREIADRVDGKAGAPGPSESGNALTLILASLKVQLGTKLDRIADESAAAKVESEAEREGSGGAAL